MEEARCMLVLSYLCILETEVVIVIYLLRENRAGEEVQGLRACVAFAVDWRFNTSTQIGLLTTH